MAVLVPERAPDDGSWGDLCTQLGVMLINRVELEGAPALALPTAGRS